MGAEEIGRFVISFLGAGLVVALLNWVKEARSAARNQEVACLQDQLRLLYAPLHCLTRQNMRTIKRAEKLQDTLNLNIKVGPHEQEIPPAQGAEAVTIIGLSNAYSAKIKENNARIRQLLEDNCTLIDMEDEDSFEAFLDDCERMQVEVDEKHAEGVADRVNQHLGNIRYIRPGFVERVTEQWNAKRARVRELLMPRRWPWSRRHDG